VPLELLFGAVPAFKKPAPSADSGCVLEIWMVVGLVGVLAAAAIVLPMLSWAAILQIGVLGVALGLGFGVPASLVYHAKLALRARGDLPPRWWLAPTRLHGRLRGDERRAVLRWFYLGGAGFVITLCGCAAALLGALLAD
jgi:hypothetical protein